jgi:hypothetical protein
MTAPVLERPSVDWERDGYQRPKIKPAPGTEWPPDKGGRPVLWLPYTRTTTFCKALDNGHALGEWKARMAVLGMGQRPDYVALAASLSAEERDKREVQKLADKAREAAGPNKADVGTALHGFTERLDRGEPVGQVPEQYRVHLENYAKATSVLRFTHYEVRTVCDELQTAGTPDRYGYCSVPDPDGIVDALRVIDTKTGRVDYPASMSIQLAIYWRSRLYDPATGARTELPELARSRWGIIVHLDALTGECQLYWLNLETGWAGAQLCAPAREWTSYAGKPANVLTPVVLEQQPATEAAAPVDPSAEHLAAIAAAVTTGDLGTLWQASGATWSTEVQQAAAARHAELAELERLRAPRAALAAALEGADGATLHQLWTEHGGTPVWTDEHSAVAERRHRELTSTAA